MSNNVKLSFSYESTQILSEILALDKGIFEPGNIFPWARVRDSKNEAAYSIHTYFSMRSAGRGESHKKILTAKSFLIKKVLSEAIAAQGNVYFYCTL